MGYNTRYSLEISDMRNCETEGFFDCNTIIAAFREEFHNASYALNEDGDTEGECKWYSAKEDLVMFSTKYPYVLFTLSGIGEESPDLWKLYVKDGLSQLAKAIIKYDNFDYSKLK